MRADDERHGTSAGYCAGCREECCRTAIADYSRNLRTRTYLARGPMRVNALGTKRRIRALMALGWTSLQIDAAIGRERTYTANVLCGPERVLLSTAKLYADMYDRLSMRLPGDEPDARAQVISRTRNTARRKGWLPPLAWDDIDDPDEQPTGIRDDTRRDLLAEWHDLRDAGESIEHAATRLGVTVGAIERAEFRARRRAA